MYMACRTVKSLPKGLSLHVGIYFSVEDVNCGHPVLPPTSQRALTLCCCALRGAIATLNKAGVTHPRVTLTGHKAAGNKGHD